MVKKQEGEDIVAILELLFSSELNHMNQGHTFLNAHKDLHLLKMKSNVIIF